MTAPPSWLSVRQGKAPLLVSLPHTGTVIPADIEARLVSPWRSRKDTDWWIDCLYGFVHDLDATIVQTAICRTVIDINRDPAGVSLYPGQATTELCPTTTFDGEPLYRPGMAPLPDEVASRTAAYFDPYHATLSAELERLREVQSRVVLYDCHSIRSLVPRLFDGLLPQFNIGTNSGASCDGALTAAIEAVCDASGLGRVTNGRFKGGTITRRHAAPDHGVHAVQMELACRGYMREQPGPVEESAWPTAFEPDYAAPMADILRHVLEQCLHFARSR